MGDWNLLGAKGAVEAIEERLTGRGKAIRRETAADLHARLQWRREVEQERETFLGSERGVKAADAERSRLHEILTQSAPAVGARVSVNPYGYDYVELMLGPWRITAAWWGPYINTLNESALTVRLRRPRVRPRGSPKSPEYTEVILHVDLRDGIVGWSGGSRFMPTEDLADHLLQTILRAAHDEKYSLKG